MIGCLAAVISNCIIGAVYYHPKTPTGKVWLKRVFPGKPFEEIENNFALGFGVVVNVLMCLLLRIILIDTLSAIDAADGLKFGVGLWCLTAMLEASHVMFAQRSLDVFLIEQLHNLLSMAASGLCIVYFQ